MVVWGSLPTLRTGTNPTPRANATGAAKMNPRASTPATTSTRPSPSRCGAASAATTSAKAGPSASSGVMSLKSTPGDG